MEEVRVAGVVFQRLVPDDFHAALHPAPPVFETGEADGDVVGHVPAQEGVGAGETRLELDDPVGKLHHLVVLALVLHSAGTEPQIVRKDASEAAQGDAGERDDWGRVLQGLVVRQMAGGADSVHAVLQERKRTQQKHHRHQDCKYS